MSLSPLDLISMTSSSLRGNLLRSFLTTLGVFMGVLAVTASLQVRSISSQMLEERLAKRDVPHVQVYPAWWRRGAERLQLEHLKFLQERLIGWRAIGAYTYADYGTVRFRDRSTQGEISVLPVSPDYFEALGTSVLKGTLFSQTEFERYRSVAIIDESVEEELFKARTPREKDLNPIGQRVYMKSQPYVVVGVIKSSGFNQQVVLIPQSTHYALTGSREFSEFIIRSKNAEDLERLGNQAKQLLEKRLSNTDIYYNTNISDIQEQQTTLNMVSNSLLVLACISLLVGGVGIANITIASVTERTKEIGLRRAIGATSFEIVLQFILEAVFLSLLGGAAAIITVHGLTVVVTDNFKLPYQFEPATAVFSLGSALLVGVGAGFFPALQASKIDPVKALRS